MFRFDAPPGVFLVEVPPWLSVILRRTKIGAALLINFPGLRLRETKIITTRSSLVEQVSNKLYKLKYQQKANTWRSHQSIHHKERERCHLEKCPCIALSKVEGAKRDHPRTTYMHCEECSTHKGQTVYLCNIRMGEVKIFCHLKYHNKYHCKKYLEAQAP